MEQWFVYLILTAAVFLLYMGYRLRLGRDRLGKKSVGNGFEKIVPETRSGGPVPEVAGCQSEKDGDLPEREAVIERILSGGISLPEDFSGFQEEHFFNRFESMDMETKSLLKEMEEKSVYAEMFLERKMTGTEDRLTFTVRCMGSLSGYFRSLLRDCPCPRL